MTTKRKSVKELETELARARAQLRAEKEKAAAEFRLKVGEKGGVSLFGHGQRFPTTLYADQWEFILDREKEIRAFIKAHESELKRKA